MPLRFYLLLVMVLSAISILSSGCSENRDTSARQTSNAGDPLPGVQPGVRLQRVFDYVEANSTILMLQAPQDDNHWYIVEKAGRVLRVSTDPASTQVDVYLDIAERVDSGPNEAGLLGMAFHPKFAQNGLAFLSYTAEGPSLTSVVTRMLRSDDGLSLNANSEEVLLRVNQPYSNHNGGHIAFGPDGYLYIGLGDGGSGGDPQGHGQNLQTLLGSMLRIDVNNSAPAGTPNGIPYAIPSTNPFANGEQGRPEIYAWGLRNPWRWSFDKISGDLWVADVGQNSWEEVSIITAPGNFGWNGKEGTHCYQSRNCNNPDFIDPVLEYSHDDGCSVTGGYVYRGSALPSLQGTYLFSDYCSGTLWGAKNNGSGIYERFEILETGFNVASFAEGNNGDVYVINLGGEFHKLVAR